LFWKKRRVAETGFVHWRIKKRCLEMILESSKSTYPNEFGALLRARDNLITEVILLPGTVEGDRHAIFNFAMLPIDYSIVGTVHSHPSGNPTPSDADLQLFSKRGKVHIIVAMPFDEYSWRGYDGHGNSIDIEVVE